MSTVSSFFSLAGEKNFCILESKNQTGGGGSFSRSTDYEDGDFSRFEKKNFGQTSWYVGRVPGCAEKLSARADTVLPRYFFVQVTDVCLWWKRLSETDGVIFETYMWCGNCAEYANPHTLCLAIFCCPREVLGSRSRKQVCFSYIQSPGDSKSTKSSRYISILYSILTISH